VVVNESNLGQFGNRNRAAQLARGRFLKYHDSDDLMYPHCLQVMVGPLEAEPRAGFAVSSGWHWPGGPCPMLLSPRMCYQREFLGPGMFNLGPACALFRAEALRDLGGFEDYGAPSDFFFWLRACKRCHVLLLPADLFWYRIHPQQEYQSGKAADEYTRGFGLFWEALFAPDCPLTPDEQIVARRNVLYILARATYRDFKAGRWRQALSRLGHARIGWKNWFRYLRRPRRSALAGTPLDATGDYVVPDWTRWQPEPAHDAEGAA
jgi:glycosyltransferase involved in cell wall biosynthesis